MLSFTKSLTVWKVIPFDLEVIYSMMSLLLDIGKQHSLRCDAAERGVPSGAILFAYRNFIEKLNKN